MSNPKVSLMMQFTISGATTYVGTEDREFWKANKLGVEVSEIVKPSEAIVLGEILQKADDPIAVLRDAGEKAKRVLVIVPNEHSWDPKFKPLQNLAHKRVYDAEMLASQLEEVGLDYLLGVLDYAGWSFLTAQAGRQENR